MQLMRLIDARLGAMAFGAASLMAFQLAARAAEKIEIEVMTWESVQNMPPFEQAVAEFERLNPGISVKITRADGYGDKLQTRIAAGIPPDLIQTGDVLTLAENGALLDLEPFIGKTSNFNRSDFFPNLLDMQYQYKGHVYALPKDIVTWGLYFNRDHLDAAGLAYPNQSWRWNDWLTASKHLTRREADGKVTNWGTFVHTWIWTMYSRQNGADGILSRDATRAAIDQPANLQAIQFLVNLMYEHGVAPPVNSGFDAEKGFLNGTLSLYPWASLLMSSAGGASANWLVAPLPYQVRRNSPLWHSGFGISSSSKHPDAAWKFVDHMTRVGSRILGQTGFSIPSRRSYAEAFLTARNRERNGAVFIATAEHAWNDWPHPAWGDINGVAGPVLDRIFRHEAPVEEFAALKPQVEAFLAKWEELRKK